MKLLQIIRMVLWSFLGIRKRAGLESDIQSPNPVAVVAVAIVLAAVFVGILLFFVNMAVR
jgi:Protein of unknown function (DUF2970)